MRVLLVDDDQALGELLLRVFSEEGIEVVWHKSVAAGLAAMAGEPDVIVLDRMLPDGDGIDFCEALRQRNDATPVLMLTARGELNDRIRGLDSGADDYLIKPFELDELLARMRALERRSKQVAQLTFGPVVIDRLQRRCTIHGKVIDLTGREFDLLLRLALADGAPVTRTKLLRDVWRMSFDPGTGVLDVHVSRLRDKLGDAAHLIETVRGVGYRWAAAP